MFGPSLPALHLGTRLSRTVCLIKVIKFVPLGVVLQLPFFQRKILDPEELWLEYVVIYF